jgi:hypothetical protein
MHCLIRPQCGRQRRQTTVKVDTKIQRPERERPVPWYLRSGHDLPINVPRQRPQMQIQERLHALPRLPRRRDLPEAIEGRLVHE